MIRALLTALVFLAAVGSGCTFTPIYGSSASQAASVTPFRYAAPASRLDQIVYRELSLRFGSSEDVGTPELRVTTATRSARLGKTDSPALNQYQVTVRATATVTSNGAVIFTATRQAAALHSNGSQVLSNTSAREEAEESAARAAAESLRLALLAKFATKSKQ